MKLPENFLINYRGRYSQFWQRRWGLIPELPTHYDNATSIYNLIAWLQRAFKTLLDDFVTLESEFEDYKLAMTELVSWLIPELFRRWLDSDEAKYYINERVKEVFDREIKPFLDNIEKNLEKLYKEKLLEQSKTIENLENKVEGLETKIERLESTLNKITENLTNSGAMVDGELTQNIAYGNINLFGGQPDGQNFIRTNKGQSENDMAGGV